jgi:hypothetical protein
MNRLNLLSGSEANNFSEGFHGIPSAEMIKKLSIIELAEEIARFPSGSVPHIIFSHELHLRLLRVELRHNFIMAFVGGAFALFSAALGVWISKIWIN